MLQNSLKRIDLSNNYTIMYRDIPNRYVALYDKMVYDVHRTKMRTYISPSHLSPTMDIATAILLGIIQGLTEWLPISSSGHLALAEHFIGETPVVFNVVLHFGTLLVLLYYFRKDISQVRKEIGAALRDMRKGDTFMEAANKNEDRKIALFVLIGIIPTGIFGMVFRRFFIEHAYSSMLVIGFCFLVSAALIKQTEGRSGKLSIFKTDKKVALMMGIGQGLAILPGISRSGSTISIGIFKGMKKEAAGRLSFLMALPAITGATVLYLPELFEADIEADLIPYLAGMLAAMVVGYISLDALMKILRGKSFHLFAYYCLGAGLFTLGIWFMESLWG